LVGFREMRGILMNEFKTKRWQMMNVRRILELGQKKNKGWWFPRKYFNSKCPIINRGKKSWCQFWKNYDKLIPLLIGPANEKWRKIENYIIFNFKCKFIIFIYIQIKLK
jgi:hypothetical protein